MSAHCGRKCLAALIMLALIGCSSLQPEKGVPPAPEGLEYPTAGRSSPPPGKAVLSPEERQKLEADLDRYKVGPD